MKINEIISQDPVCASPRTTVFEAAQMMKILDAAMLPVCDQERLVGTITDRDIAIRAVAKGCDAKHTLILDVMTDDPIYCFDDQEMDEAVRLMREYQIPGLPVLNRQHRLVGVVSLEDLAACGGREEMPADLPDQIAVGALAG
jgi:CBS domain-containing protein